jgi:hypothetical protein
MGKIAAFLLLAGAAFGQYTPPPGSSGGGGSGGSGVAYTVFRVLNQNTVAGVNFSIPAANAPTLTSVEGASSGDVTTASSAWNYGTLSFAKNGTAATSQSVQGAIPLASTWTSTAGVTLLVKWRAAAITGNVLWQIQGQCVGTGALPGNFGAAVAMTASTAAGTTLQWTDTALSTLTTANVLSGCAAGNVFLFRLFRDGTNAGDTMLGAAEMVMASFGVTQ